MKFLSTATLAATILSYVVADVSKLDLHFGGHALSRELVFFSLNTPNRAAGFDWHKYSHRHLKFGRGFATLTNSFKRN